MAFSHREKRTIYFGTAIVALTLIYLFGIDPLLQWFSGSSGSERDARSDFIQLRSEVRTVQQVQKSIAQLEKSLGVTVPEAPLNEQKKQFVQKVAELGKKSNAKIKTIVPEDRGRSRAAGDRLSYRIQLDTNHQGLVAFLQGLEKIGPPVVVSGINIKANAKTPDQLTVNLDLYTYLFKES